MLKIVENLPLLTQSGGLISTKNPPVQQSDSISQTSIMSKKQWLVLLCLYGMYLLAGAAIFYYIEAKEEHKRASQDLEERKNLEVMIREHFQGNYSARKNLFTSLTQYCGKPLDVNMSEGPVEYKWDFYHSLFFVITVVSTIGYGNLAPTTLFTRVFMIFYGLVGIPMNGIVIYTLGDFFGRSFKKLHQRWKHSKLEVKLDYYTANLGLIGQVILYLVPGFTFFIFLPSTIMTVFEGWDYDVSVYYSFVSLTTIGFGDYVAGVTDTFGFGPLYSVYQVFLLIWIVGGMGYVVMILSFITNGMRSKRIKQIEHILSENIKNTPRKIRSELRTLLHEMLFLRVKPVYKGDFEYVPSDIERSQSCPEFTMYKNESPMTRKRAMSECYRSVNFQRVQSDSDLNRIDKEKTFLSTNNLLEQTELLFKVCNALSCESLQTHESEKGIHGFSDASILASEYCDSSSGQSKMKQRRAVSDVRPPSMLLHEAVNGNTWYGADADQAIKQYKTRQRAKSVFEFKKPDRDNIFKRIRNRLLSRDEPYQDIEKQELPSNSTMSNMPEKSSAMYIRRESLVAPDHEQILEQTSIAAFIRALSAVSAPDTLEESTPQSFSPRARRHGIMLSNSRRASLIPDLHSRDLSAQRRFSLRPVDESLLKDIAKRKDPKRKVSVAFQPESRRHSLRPDIENAPQTLKEHYSFTPKLQGHRKISTSLIPSHSSSPPPYSSVPVVSQRKFSVKAVNVLVSPVQKQLQKRDKADSVSSNTKN
ncbi:hypothetical protein HUJ04_009382 [Dendroctonus ponderosae]|uniref:Potassium channel domain-containing protein n=2 Tax=Dendroctonus ponderosae TaxID=77166 RepID=A0AAR5PB60_DENPD|nr:hypothetical protein HUJ04_009382 [Dendroctonus ponderosae]